MGQGQKLLYTTHLLVVNNCTKYEKDPSNGRKVTGWTQFCCGTWLSHEHMTLFIWVKVKSHYIQHTFKWWISVPSMKRIPTVQAKLWHRHDFVVPFFFSKVMSRWPGPWFNIKMSSYQYRKSHCLDKTILLPSYLNNGISYTGKMTSLYWIGALEDMGQEQKSIYIHEKQKESYGADMISSTDGRTEGRTKWNQYTSLSTLLVGYNKVCTSDPSSWRQTILHQSCY